MPQPTTHFTVNALPGTIEAFHRLAASGHGSRYCGPLVFFTLTEKDRTSIILGEGVELILIYRKKGD